MHAQPIETPSRRKSPLFDGHVAGVGRFLVLGMVDHLAASFGHEWDLR
jgi:hypothetical protein